MLTDQEMETIKTKLGRPPTRAEEATIDALWSEHCSYKSSKRWFHLFNTEGDRVFLGIGEGAGLIDVGDGFVIGMGLESHNHPSAVDPFNGAATGVGGIIRDIVSQGCRPIAVLDCLRFGLPTTPRQKLLLDQVVLGISSYGNCVGIPNQGGDVEFADEFASNPLVNAMCVGVAHKDEIIRSIATNIGDKLLLFGSSSGRDGIGGVTFASEELDDGQQENRGSVQIGDPLTEKLLIDVIIELRDKKLLSGLQDLGGGGLVCAAVEMAEKGGNGVNLQLEKVPVRADNMNAWEILISESQERMLAVVNQDNVDDAIAIIEKFDLPWAVIGEVTEGNTFHGAIHNEIEATLPVDFTINGFPEPDRIVGEIISPQPIAVVKVEIIEALRTLLGSYNLSSRRPVYQQYDQHVQGNTVIAAGYDAGVQLLPNGKYLANAAGTNSYLTSLQAKEGAALATLGIIRKVIARGALPVGLVDSLNAGNPEKPNSYREFVDMVRGVAEVSHELSLPVVGGNVSLYNESDKKGENSKILPSPFVGVSGLIRGEVISPMISNDENTLFFLIGCTDGIIKGSEYGRLYGYEDELQLDYMMERKLLEFFITQDNLIESSTTVGKGGLLISLVKWSISSNIGLTLNDLEDINMLFGENTARYVVQISEAKTALVEESLKNIDIPFVKVATINQTKQFIFNRQTIKLSDLEEIWRVPLETAMSS